MYIDFKFKEQMLEKVKVVKNKNFVRIKVSAPNFYFKSFFQGSFLLLINIKKVILNSEIEP